MQKFKVGIIGAGVSGLCCALEFEKNGYEVEIFERDNSAGWMWPSVSFWPGVVYSHLGDPRKYLIEKYNFDFTPLSEVKKIVMKSPQNEITIKGNLGYVLSKGKIDDAIERQIFERLTKTAIHYNNKVDYKALAKEYDYVVIATGKDTEAREMGIWEDTGLVTIVGSVAVGNFEVDTSRVFFNTEYAGNGYGRITPFNTSSALIALYTIGKDEQESHHNFRKFIEMEGLNHLEYVFMNIPPTFTTGRVKKFRVGNIFLTGRAAGLTERLMGVGGVEAIVSGILAARAIINGDDYDSLAKPLQNHVENISSFRKVIESFDNNDYDKFLSFVGALGVKQLLYNSGIGFTNIFGSVLKRIKK